MADPITPLTYVYPPLIPSDPEKIIAEISQALGAQWERVARKYRAILKAEDEGAKRRALANLRDMITALREYQAAMPVHAKALADVIAGQYWSGAVLASARLGIPATWSVIHKDAVEMLAADTYADLLARSVDAEQTVFEIAQLIRKNAARPLSGQALGGTTTSAAREFRQVLEEHGISSVVYRDGSKHAITEYTTMVARTKGRVAFNTGSLTSYTTAGVQYVEVFDGAECGWASHSDPDLANGSIRTVTEALEVPISHPNCKRAFGARPDLTTKKEADAAGPLVDGLDPPLPPASGVEDKSAAGRGRARRQALQEKRKLRAQNQ